MGLHVGRILYDVSSIELLLSVPKRTVVRMQRMVRRKSVPSKVMGPFTVFEFASF